MVGNETDAELATELPHDWEGTTRIATLVGGVVYKQAFEYFMGVSWNEIEFENWKYFTCEHPLVRRPEISMYGDVLAMEYIEGKSMSECWGFSDCQHNDCLPNDVADAIRAGGLVDLAYGNVIERNGLYYVVDFGS